MASPKNILKNAKLRAKKSLGQNFLLNPHTAFAIVDKSGITADDTVLEIGPGLGALTIALAQKAKRVFAIELDRHLIPLLEKEIQDSEYPNIEVIHGDILNFDIQALATQVNSPLVVCGNLPYHISSQVVVKLIHNRSLLKSAVLMFQKELAVRFTAQPNCKDYGKLSVMVRYSANVSSLLTLNNDAFFPRPKIDSEVLQFDFKPPPPNMAENEAAFFNLVKTAFSMRRKTLKNNLSQLPSCNDGKKAEDLLNSSCIDPMRRAETLTVEEFIGLYQKFIILKG